MYKKMACPFILEVYLWLTGQNPGLEAHIDVHPHGQEIINTQPSAQEIVGENPQSVQNIPVETTSSANSTTVTGLRQRKFEIVPDSTPLSVRSEAGPSKVSMADIPTPTPSTPQVQPPSGLKGPKTKTRGQAAQLAQPALGPPAVAAPLHPGFFKTEQELRTHIMGLYAQGDLGDFDLKDKSVCGFLNTAIRGVIEDRSKDSGKCADGITQLLHCSAGAKHKETSCSLFYFILDKNNNGKVLVGIGEHEGGGATYLMHYTTDKFPDFAGKYFSINRK